MCWEFKFEQRLLDIMSIAIFCVTRLSWTFDKVNFSNYLLLAFGGRIPRKCFKNSKNFPELVYDSLNPVLKLGLSFPYIFYRYLSSSSSHCLTSRAGNEVWSFFTKIIINGTKTLLPSLIMLWSVFCVFI